MFGSDAKSHVSVFLFSLQTVYMHLKASFGVMARLVNQKIVREGEEGGEDTESYMFKYAKDHDMLNRTITSIALQ